VYGEPYFYHQELMNMSIFWRGGVNIVAHSTCKRFFTNHNRGHLHNESMKVQQAYLISRAKILTQNLIW